MKKPEDIYDEWLVLRCQAGDRTALARIVDRWQSKLLRHAGRMTGSEDAAHEVVQDSWLAICRGLSRLDDPARFRSWAYRIVSNKSADWIRRKAHSKNLPLVKEPEQSQDDSGLVEGQNDSLRRAINRLPAEHRSLLSMVYVEGMSIREIATALALPAGTVKSRLHHIRNELKEIIEREEI